MGGHESHEEGGSHEAPRHEGSSYRGSPNEGHEGHESHEEEGSHEARHEGCCSNEGYEGHEKEGSHEARHEGCCSNEGHEGHEGNEVNMMSGFFDSSQGMLHPLRFVTLTA